LFVAIDYLEVLVDDEKNALKQLNQLCGTKHDIFTKAIIPRKSLPIESPDVKTIEDRKLRHVDVGRIFLLDQTYSHISSRGKILFLP
jgi:hypothetical protein